MIACFLLISSFRKLIHIENKYSLIKEDCKRTCCKRGQTSRKVTDTRICKESTEQSSIQEMEKGASRKRGLEEILQWRLNSTNKSSEAKLDLQIDLLSLQ